MIHKEIGNLNKPIKSTEMDTNEKTYQNIGVQDQIGFSLMNSTKHLRKN